MAGAYFHGGDMRTTEMSMKNKHRFLDDWFKEQVGAAAEYTWWQMILVMTIFVILDAGMGIFGYKVWTVWQHAGDGLRTGAASQGEVSSIFPITLLSIYGIVTLLGLVPLAFCLFGIWAKIRPRKAEPQKA